MIIVVNFEPVGLVVELITTKLFEEGNIIFLAEGIGLECLDFRKLLVEKILFMDDVDFSRFEDVNLEDDRTKLLRAVLDNLFTGVDVVEL